MISNNTSLSAQTEAINQDMIPCGIEITEDAADPDLCYVFPDVKPTDLCSFPTDPGTCDGKERRFTYNSITKRCQAFIYSGCGGNENNFVLRKNCIAKCKGRKGMPARSVTEMCISLLSRGGK